MAGAACWLCLKAIHRTASVASPRKSGRRSLARGRDLRSSGHGVTVAEDGPIFVNSPRWSEDVPVSVAELGKNGSIKPYPNAEWSNWRNARMSSPH